MERSYLVKKKQLNLKIRSMYWLLSKKSKLSTKNKLLIYKSKIKPVWTYGIQLWGTASNSNIQIIERFSSVRDIFLLSKIKIKKSKMEPTREPY